MNKTEHREELHRRILERQAALTTTRTALTADAHTVNGEQCRAVDQALAQLEIHLKSGWENVGEVEAAELSRWLESTSFLPQAANVKTNTKSGLEKSLACQEIVPGCRTVLNGKNEQQVMERATAHAKSAHHMEVLSPDTIAKAKAAIKDRQPLATG